MKEENVLIMISLTPQGVSVLKRSSLFFICTSMRLTPQGVSVLKHCHQLILHNIFGLTPQGVSVLKPANWDGQKQNWQVSPRKG